MPAGQRPLVRRRLRLELREERERAGKSQAEVAKKMDWSLSKIIRLEAGQVNISTNDLKALLDLYRVNDGERRAFLINLARSARQQSPWWAAYRDIAPSPEYLDFIGYQEDASAISYYCSVTVPGLLQQADYARDLIEKGSPVTPSDEDVERGVELRMARKQVLDRDDPLRLDVVIDEAVIHRVVGGAEVMVDQLTSLAEMATVPDVTIQIVPFSVGAHPGQQGPFNIIEFADPSDMSIVQLDSAPTGVILRDNPEMIKIYEDTFKRLQEIALPEAQSLELIDKVVKTLEKELDSEE